MHTKRKEEEGGTKGTSALFPLPCSNRVWPALKSGSIQLYQPETAACCSVRPVALRSQFPQPEATMTKMHSAATSSWPRAVWDNFILCPTLIFLQSTLPLLLFCCGGRKGGGTNGTGEKKEHGGIRGSLSRNIHHSPTVRYKQRFTNTRNKIHR